MKTVTISHIRVCDANAASSPITAGFPAIPAVLGAVKAAELGMEGVKFPATAIVIHSCHVFGRPEFHKGARVMKPIIEKRPLGRNGENCALEESIRCNLDISLVIKTEGPEFGRKDVEEKFKKDLRRKLMSHPFAGGTVTGIGGIWLSDIKDKRLFRALCPGYLLVSRKEEFRELMADGRDALEILVDCCSTRETEDGRRRLLPGWKMPVGVGFRGLTDPVEGLEEARDTKPLVFAEALITLGECVFVTKVKEDEKMFWHYDHNGRNYECACGAKE